MAARNKQDKEEPYNRYNAIVSSTIIRHGETVRIEGSSSDRRTLVSAMESMSKLSDEEENTLERCSTRGNIFRRIRLVGRKHPTLHHGSLPPHRTPHRSESRSNAPVRLFSFRKIKSESETDASEESDYTNQTTTSEPELETFNQENLDNCEHKSTKRRTVCFTRIHIREYSMILGDHPCCSEGLPLSLGWDHTETRIIEIDDYERVRGPRRKSEQLKMGSDLRKSILSGDGCDKEYSSAEIRRAERRLYRERKNKKCHNKFFNAPLLVKTIHKCPDDC